jgi:hypothetical protein
LIPEYNYSSNTEYRTSLNDEEIRVFMKILLNQNKFSVGKAINLTKHILQTRGIEIMVKDATLSLNIVYLILALLKYIQ